MMKKLWERIKEEPIATTNAIALLVEAILGVFVVFGMDLTPEQTAAILGAIVVVGKTIATFVGRSVSTPVDSDLAMMKTERQIMRLLRDHKAGTGSDLVDYGVRPASLYPALMRLEANEQIDSEWQGPKESRVKVFFPASRVPEGLPRMPEGS